MLELTREEWAALCAGDDRNFVAVMRDDIVRDYPALADDPTLSDRLQGAYARAKELGFTHNGAIVDFLYLEASAPGFYRIPAIAAWLGQTGMPAEERFNALLSATGMKLREKQEKN